MVAPLSAPEPLSKHWNTRRTLVIHVELGNGVNPLILHHVGRQNCTIHYFVISDVSRQISCRDRSCIGPLWSSSVTQLATVAWVMRGCHAVTSLSTETPSASYRARTSRRLALLSRERRKHKRLLINEKALVNAPISVAPKLYFLVSHHTWSTRVDRWYIKTQAIAILYRNDTLRLRAICFQTWNGRETHS